jgi:hypothetical protein
MDRSVRYQAFGDSHVHYTFCRLRQAKVHWVGPTLAHTFANNWFDILLPYKRQFRLTDTLLLAFGEIDIRCHVIRIARRGDHTPEEVVIDLAHRYVMAAAQARYKFDFKNAIVSSVIPPTGDEGLGEYPRIGSLKQRVEATRMFNTMLEARCKHHGLTFLNYTDDLAGEDGSLKADISDGDVHLHPQHQGLLSPAFARIGLPVELRPFNAQDMDLSRSAPPKPRFPRLKRLAERFRRPAVPWYQSIRKS